MQGRESGRKTETQKERVGIYFMVDEAWENRKVRQYQKKYKQLDEECVRDTQREWERLSVSRRMGEMLKE